MFDLTTHQTKAIMNEVKSRMEDRTEFTRKDIFDYLSEYDDFGMSYSDIKEEFNFIVDRAVKEVGGYKSEFTEDYDGKVVFRYKPLNEDEDDEDVEEDECDCNECEEEDECDHNVIDLTVGNKNRVYITRQMFEDADIDPDDFTIEKNDGEIILRRVDNDREINDNEDYAYAGKCGQYQVAVKTALGAEEYDIIQAEINDGEIVLTR